MYVKEHFLLVAFLFNGMQQYAQENRRYLFQIDGNKKVKTGCFTPQIKY
jgi:hypothetical protein